MKHSENFFRLILLILLVFGAVLACKSNTHAPKKDSRPNVVLISIDTCRTDYLEPYGGAKIKTPAMASLAKEGIVFDDAVTSVPMTVPSHATLMTGLHPIQHGVRDNYNRILPEEAITLAELFHQAGYATAGIAGAIMLSRQNGFSQGFDFFDDHFQKSDFLNQKATVERRAEKVVQSGQSWLNTHLSSSESPFFLFLHFYDPHMLYDPPVPFKTLYAKDLYGGEIAYVDSCIDQFIGSLKKSGLYEDALIVAVGDHGEGLGDHKEITHGLFLYEEAVHVPLIVKPPKGSFKTGIRIPQLVSLADVMPTLADLCGLKKQETYGISLVPWLKDPGTVEDRWIVLESMYPLTYNWSPLYAVRGKDKKYIHAPKAEYFDLTADRKEQNNLIVSAADQVKDLKNILESNLVEINSKKPFQAGEKQTGNQMDVLSSLGYIGGGNTDVNGAALDTGKQLADPKDKVDVYTAIDKGLAYLVNNDFMNAMQIFSKAEKMDPSNPSAILNIGLVYGKMNNFEKAIQYTKKALEFSPEALMIQLQLSRYYILNKQCDEAKKILETVIKNHPQLAEAYYQLGEAAFRENQKKEALEYMQKAKELIPEMPGMDERIQDVMNAPE